MDKEEAGEGDQNVRFVEHPEISETKELEEAGGGGKRWVIYAHGMYSVYIWLVVYLRFKVYHLL